MGYLCKQEQHNLSKITFFATNDTYIYQSIELTSFIVHVIAFPAFPFLQLRFIAMNETNCPIV